MTVSVVGTSDLHGGVLPEEGRGGLVLLDGYVRNLRAARQSDGGGVLLIDGSADEEIFQVARAFPAGLVDAVVAGHRHFGIAHEVAGIPIVSSYSHGRAFGRVDLIVDPRTGRVTSHRIFPPQDLCAAQDGDQEIRSCSILQERRLLTS